MTRCRVCSTGYPPALDQLLDHALAKDPADRYETAEEMAADIEAINDELKREHVGEVLGNVKHLMDQEKWTSVRPVLLDLQRLNPQNTEVKKLLREVQEKLSRQQKTGQLRQLLEEAEEAVLSQRYADALEFYKQAEGVDRGNSELAQKIEHVRGLKEKADKVASLLGQAREARTRSNFGAASELIDKALQLDERNTDLRNERARILQEAERASRERARREFSDAARGQLAAQQYRKPSRICARRWRLTRQMPKLSSFTRTPSIARKNSAGARSSTKLSPRFRNAFHRMNWSAHSP